MMDIGESRRSDHALVCDTTRIVGRTCHQAKPQDPFRDSSAADRTRLGNGVLLWGRDRFPPRPPHASELFRSAHAHEAPDGKRFVIVASPDSVARV
jgi:hypothetical protein